MKEALVCTRVVNSLKRDGYFAFKIPDMPRTGGTSFNRKKAFDIIAAIYYGAIFIEVKINPSMPKTWNSFLKLFTDNQIKIFNEATRARQAKCYALLCVYNQETQIKRHELWGLPWSLRTPKDYRQDLIRCPYSKAHYDLSDLFPYF